MAEESGNQTLRTSTTSAGALDAGTDTDQTNHEPSSGTEQQGKTETASGAGGTSIKANTAETYGAGDPENFTGGTTPGGAVAETGHGTGADTTGMSGDTDLRSRGASQTADVTRETDKGNDK